MSINIQRLSYLVAKLCMTSFQLELKDLISIVVNILVFAVRLYILQPASWASSLVTYFNQMLVLTVCRVVNKNNNMYRKL